MSLAEPERNGCPKAQYPAKGSSAPICRLPLC